MDKKVELQKFIGDKIKFFRESQGISQEKLGELLGTTKQTVSRYETGKRSANQDVLFKLSDIFGVSIDEFFPPREDYVSIVKEDTAEYNVNNSYVFFDKDISAGIPEYVEGVTERETRKITLPNSIMGKWAGHKDVFITRINGDSMNNVMEDGALIAVKPVELSQLKNGDIVVYCYDGEYAVKRFYKYDNKIIFRPDSSDIRFTDLEIDLNDENLDLKIHGKVVVYIVELD